MAQQKILLSNLGYGRGIDGSLGQHIRLAHRHFYVSKNVQRDTLRQFKTIVEEEKPDICCLVEIEKGTISTGRFNQLEALLCEDYRFWNLENKYGAQSQLRRLPFTQGKSNGFIAKNDVAHEKLYLRHGAKRLVYKIALSAGVSLFFAHLSLKKNVRLKQLAEIRELMDSTPGEVIFLGDFNILTGFTELDPLLHDRKMVLMNRKEDHTFMFHTRKLVLDVALCTPAIAKHATLKVIPQPYSDHAALLLTVEL